MHHKHKQAAKSQLPRASSAKVRALCKNHASFLYNKSDQSEATKATRRLQHGTAHQKAAPSYKISSKASYGESSASIARYPVHLSRHCGFECTVQLIYVRDSNSTATSIMLLATEYTRRQDIILAGDITANAATTTLYLLSVSGRLLEGFNN